MTLRPITVFAAGRITNLAKRFPVNDLLDLRMDIAKPEVVNHWFRNLEEKTILMVTAEVTERIAGYVHLHHNQVTWQRGLGEIRILVGLA